MSQKYKVDFATFCYSGDAHRLHKPGQLKRQIESNSYEFNSIIVIYQKCNPDDYAHPEYGFTALFTCYSGNVYQIKNIDQVLKTFGINKAQYTSTTDQAHHWKYHVVNHLTAISKSNADYIVFADNDCWMVEQPEGKSWVEKGIEILQSHPDIFIISPNDGERQRRTTRYSQQMFLARVDEFRKADFNQPEWDGNVNIPGGPMPEYWGMLEGRMELYCRTTGQYRYVLGPEYRYWHHNRLNSEGYFETNRSKY